KDVPITSALRLLISGQESVISELRPLLFFISGSSPLAGFNINDLADTELGFSVWMRDQFSVGVLRTLSTTSTSNAARLASNLRPNPVRPSKSDAGEGDPSRTRRASGGKTRPAAVAARINITL